MLRIIVCLTLVASVLRLPLAAAADHAEVPVPFKVTYAVSYRGIKAGLLHMELRPAGEGRYVYESRATPGLLASFIVSRKAVERSTMRIDADGVRPLSWFLDDGKSGSDDDGTLQFDWDRQRVTGIVDGQQVDLPTEPGLQDRLSYQIAVMTALLRGEEPGTIPMLDKDRIKPYSYSRRGTGPVETPGGTFEAVLYESTRPGSSRLSRIWHAPAIGNLAVRFERLNKGTVETVMELVEVVRNVGG